MINRWKNKFYHHWKISTPIISPKYISKSIREDLCYKKEFLECRQSNIDQPEILGDSKTRDKLHRTNVDILHHRAQQMEESFHLLNEQAIEIYSFKAKIFRWKISFHGPNVRYKHLSTLSSTRRRHFKASHILTDRSVFMRALLQIRPGSWTNN